MNGIPLWKLTGGFQKEIRQKSFGIIQGYWNFLRIMLMQIFFSVVTFFSVIILFSVIGNTAE